MNRLPTINASRCPNARGGDCSRCADACPTQALRLEPTPCIDPDACRSCGACAAACPSGALSFSPGENLLRAVQRLGSSHAVRVCCFGVKRPDNGVTEVGACLSAIGPDILVSLAALGVERVEFLHGDCANCLRGDGARQFHQGRRVAQSLLAHAERRAVFHVTSLAQTVQAGALSRRGFLGILGVMRQRAEDNLRGAESQASGKIDLQHRSSCARLHRALVQVRASGAEPLEAMGGELEMHGSCNACGACARICPTGAISLHRRGNGFRLVFSPWLCVRCGLCERSCLARCLSVKPGDVDSLSRDAPRELASGRLYTCSRCNAGTAVLVDGLYCALCAKRLGLAAA